MPFNTITGADWARSLAAARKRRKQAGNRIREAIKTMKTRTMTQHEQELESGDTVLVTVLWDWNEEPWSLSCHGWAPSDVLFPEGAAPTERDHERALQLGSKKLD